MGSRIPAGFANLVLHFMTTGDPDIDASQFGFGISGDFSEITQSQAADIAQALAILVQSEASEESTVVGWRLEGPNDAGPSLVLEGGLSQDGASGNPMVPQNTCYLLKKTTNVPGRGGRGRNYIPGVPENLVGNNGLLGGSVVEDYATGFAAFLTDVATDGIYVPFTGMVVLHGEGSSTELDDPGFCTAVTCDSVVATQRRRLRH